MLKSLLSLFGRKPGDRQTDAAPVAAPPREPDSKGTPTYLRRQPMIDRAERVVAYELATDRHQAFRAHQWQPVTRRLFDDLLLSQFARSELSPLLGQPRVFLPVGSGIVDHPMVETAARENVVLRLTWHDNTERARDDSLLARIARLREMGIALACADDFADDPGVAAAADYITIDVSRIDPARLLDVFRRAARRSREHAPIAMNVDSVESYQACRDIGFAWFHGELVRSARQGDRRSEVPPYRLAALQLMEAIRRQASVEELAEKAWSDPTLVLRLLRYVNSPAVGLRTPIDDLKHAIAYLGYDELYRWVTLLLFSVHRARDGDPMQYLLRETALVRGRLMEQLGAGRLPARECTQLFVTGVLSSLHLLLGMPMEEVLKRFTLPPDVTQALLRAEGPFARYLDLAFACERGDEGSIERLAGLCGLDAETVNRLHIEALQWMLEFAAAAGEEG